jgi:hypothetical protein
VYADGDPLGIASAGTLVGVVSAGTLDGDESTPALQRFTRIDAWLRRSSAALQGSTGAMP